MSNMSECEPTTDKKNTFTLQGGEQKGMKKIVSLALSTAMALSMFASVTSAATLTTQEKYDALVTQGIFAGYPDGNAYLDKDMTRAEFAKVVALLTGLDTSATGTNSYQDQNYANAWYKPFVEAVTKAGYMQGTTTGSVKKFNPNGKVTVQEMAATLVRAAKLEVPTTGISNSASAWAKGEVQAAINAGLVSNTANFTAAATRGLLVDTAYAYQTKVSKPAVTSYEVTENGATVVFTLANGEKVTVKPTTALKANVATTVTFTYNNFEYSESVTWAVSAATAIQSVSATNYKTVTVVFDGEVAEASATDESNYSLPNRTIESATLSADKRTVTLLLTENGSALTQQQQTTLTVNGVQNSNGTKTFTTETKQFTPVDTTVPTVASAKALGTGAIRVEFSEPVTRATATNLSNYKLDGNVIAGGSVVYNYPNVAIITGSFTVGQHTLNVANVADFAGFQVAGTDTSVTVVADNAAPEVVSAVATDLNKVVVTFNEPVKSVSSAYQTSTNRPAATTVINDNKVTLTFTEANRLGLGQSTVYLQGVTDYSNNSANRTATVTPELDTVRPTVTSVTAKTTADGRASEITVKFSEAVRADDALSTGNYVLKNSSGTVVSGRGFTSAGNPSVAPKFAVTTNNQTSTDTVVITSLQALEAGTYTLEISGVRDRSAFGNTMVPQSESFTTTQAGQINPIAAWVEADSNNAQQNIYVTFDRAVATSGNGSALDVNKYAYSVSTVQNGAYRSLPNTATVSLSTADTIRITVPNTDIGTEFVSGGTQGSTIGRGIRVTNVADLNGNTVPTTGVQLPLAQSRTAATIANTAVTATSTSTLTATFAGNLTYVDINDFQVSVGAATYTAANGSLRLTGEPTRSGNTTTVSFTVGSTTTNENPIPVTAAGVSLSTIRSQENILSSDVNGRKVVTFNKTADDAVAPARTSAAITGVRTAANNGFTVTVPYNEALVVNATQAAFQVRVEGVTVDATKVTARANGNDLEIVVRDQAVGATDRVEVELVGNPTSKYVADARGNAVANFVSNPITLN